MKRQNSPETPISQKKRKRRINENDEEKAERIMKKEAKKQMKQMITDEFINKIQILKEKKENAKTEEEIEEIRKEIESFNFPTEAKTHRIHRKDTHPFQICYQGEGLAYEHLLKLDCFKKVVWNAKTDDEKCPSITLNNNHQYHIADFGEHFDIYAEDNNGQRYYFEVKATTNNSRNTKITQCQTRFGRYIELKEGHYIIASVSNVLTSPSVSYYLFIPGADISKTKIEFDDENGKEFLQKISEIKSNKMMYVE